MGLPAQWDTSCVDWEKRIVEGSSLMVAPPLFPETASRALEVFHSLIIVDAGNIPFGDSTREWIDDFVLRIFGAYDAETGIRHITEFFMLISKKNSKSTLAAGIMLTALILNWRPEAEFIILSPTVEIAQNSFKPAAAMVNADPELKKLFLVQSHIRTITHRVTGAQLKVVAADSNTVGGKKAVGVLVDELWLLGKQQKAEDMLREAIGGLASRPEGFVIYLTTQSNEPPTGVFKTKLDYARGVRDGRIKDPAFLPVIYEFPMAMIEAGEHMRPENFYVTNPNMGLSVNEAFLLREYAKAQEEGEESVRGFLAKHMNVEIGLNLRADRWPGVDFWLTAFSGASNVDKVRCVSLQTIIERSEVITIGIDGGGLDDLLGFSAIGRDYETQEWLSYSYAWAHQSVLKRRKDIESKLVEIKRAGEMTHVTLPEQDISELTAMVKQVFDADLLYKVGLDPAMSGVVFDALLQADIPEDRIVGVSQGWKLAGAIKTTERKLFDGILKHGGTSLMNWSVGNAKVVVRGNAVLVTKQMSGTAKIDPLMSLFNAAELMGENPPAMRNTYDFSLMAMG